MADISNFLERSQAASEAAGQQLSESISQGLFDLTGGEIGQASPARLEKIQNAKIAGFQADFAASLKDGDDYIGAYSKLLGNLTSIGADTTEVEKALGTLSTQAERLSQQTERGKTTRKIVKDVNGVQRYVDTGESVFSGVEKTAGTAQQRADSQLLSDLINELGESAGAAKYREIQHQKELEKEAAGVTEAQEGIEHSVTVSLNNAYNKSIKPLTDSIGQLDRGLSFVNQLEAGNPAAQPQLDKMLATLSGDTQLSEVEVKRVLRVGNLPTRIVDTVSRFFLGTEAAETVEEKKTLISAMREVIIARRKLEQARLKEVWKHTQGVTDEILNDMFSIPNDKSSGYTQEDVNAELLRRGLL